jgi:hypothetical protein
MITILRRLIFYLAAGRIKPLNCHHSFNRFAMGTLHGFKRCDQSTTGGQRMKQIFAAIAILVAGTVFTSAQEVKVEKKVEERPGVNVQVPVPDVRIEERKHVEERRHDCDTKTVEKETPHGDTSVTTKRCD